MDVLGTLSTVYKALFSNKLRSFLTLLGIIFGVATVITMMGITEGFRSDFMGRLSSLGTKNIYIRYDFSKRGSQRSKLFVMEDLRYLLRRSPFLSRAMPSVGGLAKVKFMDKEEELQLTGTTPDIYQMMGLELERGRMFTDRDVRERATITVLGHRPKELLFGQENPIGKTVLVRRGGRRVRFTVIGYFSEKSGWSGRNINESLVMPYTTLRYKLLGARDFNSFWVEAKEYQMVERAEAQIQEIFDKRGVPVFTWAPKEQLELQKEMFDKITLFGLVISGISLLVGGIGIMNIMLVSVMERINEIGLRRAIGARKIDILSQFLLESVLVGCIGGLLAVPLGITGSIMFGKFLDIGHALYYPSIFVALLFDALVSVVFGYYPAKKAAELEPAEALRYG